MGSECKVHRERVALATALVLWCAAAGAAPLAGRIWAPAEQRFVPAGTVIEAAASADVVLLGETHTIARHHELQARLLRAAARDRRPLVVFEMVGRDQQPAIDRWRRAEAPDPDDFGAAVRWTERGWPDWAIYRPIMAAALERDLPIRGGAPSEDAMHRVAREGLAGLDSGQRSALGLERALPDFARARLARTLDRAHCGLPDSAPVDRMIAVQRLRDAAMAEQLRRATDGAVLIAGHGHVRRDYGVPLYLGERRVLSIAFMGADDLAASAADGDGSDRPFDYIWYTQGRVDLPDCAQDDGAGAH